MDLLLKLYDGATPTPDSEASTLTVKCLVGSGCFRMGAKGKAVLSLLKALSALGFYCTHFGSFLSKAVSGVVMELKLLINLLWRLAKPRKVRAL